MNDDAASRLAGYLGASAPAGVHAVYLFVSHVEGRVHGYITLDLQRAVNALDDLEPIERFFAAVAGQGDG